MDNQAGCWPNQRLVAVLAHLGGGALGGGGHWVPYRKEWRSGPLVVCGLNDIKSC